MLNFVTRTINTALRPLGVRMVRERRLSCATGNLTSIPFSGNREEAILQDLVRTVETLDKSYVDVGASDGLVMSNTARLALNGWHGVCFEYDPRRFAVLADAYGDL